MYYDCTVKIISRDFKKYAFEWKKDTAPNIFVLTFTFSV